MDPWVGLGCDKDTKAVSANGDLPTYEEALISESELRNQLHNNDNGTPVIQQFEDQFVLRAEQSDPLNSAFEKLPDSSVYLASLEKKLKAVQSGGPKKNTSAGILQSLEQTRESCMVNLLTNSDTNLGNRALDDIDFDELKVNPILKKIAPEKQAVALEELVHLVKADQLSILLDEDAEQNVETAKEVIETNEIDIVEKSNREASD